MEETRQQVNVREKVQSRSMKKRLAEILIRFAPAKVAGWQIEEG